MSASKHRVLFVVPPVRLQREEFEYLLHWPRHALALSAELGDEYECAILDNSIEYASQPPGGIPGSVPDSALEEAIRLRIREFRPDVVCVHAHAAPHVPIVAKTLRSIVAEGGWGALVIGGMAAAHLPDVIARLAPVGTFIVRSEVSGRARALFSTVLGAPAPGVQIAERPDGRRELTVAGGVETLDYPRPEAGLLPMDSYATLFRERDFVPHLEFSSGCSYHCTFCGVHYPGARGRYRRRPVRNVVDELRSLRDRYGFDEFYFCDETFTLDREGAADLCEAMATERLEIRWRCVTRADHLDDPMLERMARAGCYEIGIGVESGDERVVHGVAKQSTPSVHQRAIEAIQRHGIVANALTILGSPLDDHASIRRTFEFLARHARPKQVQIFVFTPVPGTVYFQQPERFGLRVDTRDLNAWYEFDHIAWPVCDTPHLSRDDIVRYFMLFNRALPTIIDPEPDPALIDRVLANRFPVRLKGVSWMREGPHLRIFRPRDGAGSILENSVLVEVDPEASEVALSVDVLELILALSTGVRTREEIASCVAGAYAVPAGRGGALVDAALSLLEGVGVVGEF